MNGIGKFWLAKLIVDMLVTLAFLGFAYLFRGTDKTLGGMVLGAALMYWFSSSQKAGATLSSPPGYSTVSVKGENPPSETP